MCSQPFAWVKWLPWRTNKITKRRDTGTQWSSEHQLVLQMLVGMVAFFFLFFFLRLFNFQFFHLTFVLKLHLPFFPPFSFTYFYFNHFNLSFIFIFLSQWRFDFPLFFSHSSFLISSFLLLAFFFFFFNLSLSFLSSFSYIRLCVSVRVIQFLFLENQD